MVASNSFAEFLHEQLAPLGRVTMRRMFADFHSLWAWGGGRYGGWHGAGYGGWHGGGYGGWHGGEARMGGFGGGHGHGR